MRPECVHKIVKKYIRRDRWYVKLSQSFNGQYVWRNAHFVWLIGNPAFQDIPKNYVIHHLDGDPLNDDISNLVLMQKYHHTSYHLKYIAVETKVSLYQKDPARSIYYPIREPRFYKVKNRNRIRLYFNEWDEDTGKSKKVFINSWQGKPITTSEMAEEIKNLIWKPADGIQ